MINPQLTVALVGRPNVGKSTLFNRLTRSRNALVADVAGVTRDRQYGIWKSNLTNSPECNIVDTGGILPADEADYLNDANKQNYLDMVRKQANQAIVEADIILFLMDAKAGIVPADEFVLNLLRKSNTKFLLVLNKIDGVAESNLSEFYKFGMDIMPIAATSRRGVNKLNQKINEILLDIDLTKADKEATTADKDVALDADCDIDNKEEQVDTDEGLIEFAIVGRPNVGKSTLINRMLGEERMITANASGTTIDSIKVPLSRFGKKYTLVDTAGVRRKSHITDIVEKFSTIKARDAIYNSMVSLLVLDAQTGIVEQDMRLLKNIIAAGRPLVLAVNKWDDLDSNSKKHIESELERKLQGKLFFDIHYISALHGSGVGNLFSSIDEAHAASNKVVKKNDLSSLLEYLAEQHSAALVDKKQIKIKFARQIDSNPPTFALHGNQLLAQMKPSYVRYLANAIRKAFKLHGTAIRIKLCWQTNPYQKDNKIAISKHQMFSL